MRLIYACLSSYRFIWIRTPLRSNSHPSHYHLYPSYLTIDFNSFLITYPKSFSKLFYKASQKLDPTWSYFQNYFKTNPFETFLSNRFHYLNLSTIHIQIIFQTLKPLQPFFITINKPRSTSSAFSQSNFKILKNIQKTFFNKDGNGTGWIPRALETGIRDGYLANPSSLHRPKYIKPIQTFFAFWINLKNLFKNERHFFLSMWKTMFHPQLLSWEMWRECDL